MERADGIKSVKYLIAQEALEDLGIRVVRAPTAERGRAWTLPPAIGGPASPPRGHVVLRPDDRGFCTH